MACFCSGLAATAFAVVGPPGAYDDVFFYAHMTQHILLTMLAAPLLVLGDPVLLVFARRQPGDPATRVGSGAARPPRARAQRIRSSAGSSSSPSWA